MYQKNTKGLMNSKVIFLFLLQPMSQAQPKPTHLPKDPGLRAQLIKRLQQKLSTLTNSGDVENNKSQFEPVDPKVEKNIGVLKLRIKLIGDCTELSVERIEHLEQIFKHYCTHIFKIGKHMTFQRLQYEKVHLTLDRLCVFLKDFGLTTAKIGQVQHEIIDKQQIVRNFKRLSKNCRDLSFEEFIACLEKLSGVYYDEKQFYVEKMSRIKQQREARIQEYKKKMKEKKRLQAQRKALQNSLNTQNIVHNEENGQAQEKHDKQEGQQNEQNDDLVQKMMQDDKIQNPNDQIQKASNGQAENQFESQVKNKESKINKKQSIKIQQEYILTVEEKIEYFYQLVGVDNVHDFRKKMSELGLPLFKQYQHSAKPIIHKRSTSTKVSSDLLNVTVQNGQQQDQRRLIQLRQKLNIKRERDKHMYSPVISKQEYQERKKRRQQRQAQIMKEMNVSKVGSEHTTAREKQKQKKKIELTDKQLSLDMLNHISFDQLKIKFDPKKYVGSDESDQVYLNQYGVEIDQISSHPRKKQAKSSISKPDIREKTATTLQRKRTSSNIVQDFKKRAYEMQVKQFHKEAELSKFVNDMKKKQKFRNQKL